MHNSFPSLNEDRMKRSEVICSYQVLLRVSSNYFHSNMMTLLSHFIVMRWISTDDAKAMICQMLFLWMNQSSGMICTTVIIFFITIQSQFQKMPGFTKDILGKRVSRIDFYQIFHHENTWFFNICVIKLKYAYSTLLLNIYKETDKQKHQYNCLSWTGCFFS